MGVDSEGVERLPEPFRRHVRRGLPARRGGSGRLVAAVSLLVAAGCAERVLPEIPVAPVTGWNYVESRRPAGGADLTAPQQETLETGWAWLLAANLREAEGALQPLLAEAPEDPGVLAASGYLELRRGRPELAEPLFDEALARDAGSALAALGGVLTALGSEDRETLYSRLRRLEAIEPEAPAVVELLPDVVREVADSRLAAARDAVRAGAAGSEIAEAYAAALEAVPDSIDLVFEAAEAAAAAGGGEQARRWFEQVARDPDAGEREALTASIEVARLLAESGRVAEGLTRIDRIRADARLGRQPDLRERARELADRLAYARLTERYDRIRETERGTREQLAAALVLALGIPDPDTGGARVVIAVDLERSWAADQILAAVGAGYLRLFPDNTFKPRDYVTRAELAEALDAALAALDRAAWRDAGEGASELEFNDVPRGRRTSGAIDRAVGLGLLAAPGGAFRPLDFASGAEIVRAVEALRDRLGRS